MKKRVFWKTIAGVILAGIPVQAQVVASGSGTLSTPSATAFRATAQQATALGDWMGDHYTAGAQISITGTMTLVGDNGNHLNDKVGFAIANAPESTGMLNTSGTSGESSYAFYLSTTMSWPGPNERYTLAKAGVDQRTNQTVEAAPQDGTVAFALNLLFPDTYANGVNGTHVYEYELGLDYNQDGFYEVIETGTFVAYENNRIRFGFLVTKGPGDPAVSLANNYSYTIQEGFVPLPRPRRIRLLSIQ